MGRSGRKDRREGASRDVLAKKKKKKEKVMLGCITILYSEGDGSF